MNAREYAINVINSMSDEKLIAFITLFADENYVEQFTELFYRIL